MTAEDQKREAMHDVDEFFAYLASNPEKSCTLRLVGGKGKLLGSGLELNKPAGRGLNFTEE